MSIGPKALLSTIVAKLKQNGAGNFSGEIKIKQNTSDYTRRRKRE
jgi:hypothetical protein